MGFLAVPVLSIIMCVCVAIQADSCLPTFLTLVHQRRREYSDGSHPVSGRLPVVPTNSHFVNPAGREEAKQVQRSWSPDRTTIDKQLEAMRKHCSEAAVSLTSYVAS